MKILITGGAGYLGSAIVPRLIKKNYKVTVLDNLYFKQFTLHDMFKYDNFEFILEDVRNFEKVNEIAKEFDLVLPLAGLVGAPLCDLHPIDAVKINQTAVEELCRSLPKDIKIIVPVTNSGYGISKPDEICTEETKLNPISIYGKTKVAAEKITLERGNSISFRLATVFGVTGRMRTDLLVNNFVLEAVTKKYLKIFEGHFMRNYIHVQDVSRVILFAIENFEKLKNNSYNFGLEDANLSKIQLANFIKKYVPDLIIEESNDGKDPDQRNYTVSNKKIIATGFEFKYSLDIGVRELIKAYKMLPDKNFSNL